MSIYLVELKKLVLWCNSNSRGSGYNKKLYIFGSIHLIFKIGYLVLDNTLMLIYVYIFMYLYTFKFCDLLIFWYFDKSFTASFPTKGIIWLWEINYTNHNFESSRCEYGYVYTYDHHSLTFWEQNMLRIYMISSINWLSTLIIRAQILGM